MVDASDIRDREKIAIEETTRERKRDAELRGDYRTTGEEIERGVKRDLEEIHRKRDHDIYKGR